MNDNFKIYNHIILALLENNASVFMKGKGTGDTVGQLAKGCVCFHVLDVCRGSWMESTEVRLLSV